MPKTKLGEKYSHKDPPIDWLWAAVLERKAAKNLDLKQLANMGGISYDTMRHYIRESPWNWPVKVRTGVCNGLGLTFNFDPSTIKTEGEV
jgi:hypothetical protein